MRNDEDSTEAAGSYWSRLTSTACFPDFGIIVAMTVRANGDSRALEWPEVRIARHMLEYGSSEAQEFLPQSEVARASHWRCPCGCTSFNFVIEGMPLGEKGFYPLDQFLFSDDLNLSGIFVWERDGVLGGVEVFTITAEVSKRLPSPESLRLAVASIKR